MGAESYKGVGICLHCTVYLCDFKINLIALFLITGVDPEYDQALADIQETKTWFDQYLKKQCSALGCKVSV